jgi:hypothetical protein
LRVVEHSILWKEKDASKVFTYQGLTTCTEVDRSWTIMSSAYNHVPCKRGKDERSMAMFIRKEVEHQERLEAAGYATVTNVEGAERSTIPTLGDTAARRVGGGCSSLLLKCSQRNSPVLGEQTRTNCLFVGWPG